MKTYISLIWKQISTQHAYWQHWKIKYMTKKAKDLKSNYIEQIKQQHNNRQHTWPVEIEIWLVFGDKVKRDRDNYHKITMDSLQDSILIDDSQIVKAIVTKQYIPKVRVTNITITDAEVYWDSIQE